MSTDPRVEVVEVHHPACHRYRLDPPGYWWDMGCSCAYVARIEADLRERIAAEILAACDVNYPPCTRCLWCAAIARGGTP